jgi:hypothetical protein
MNHPHVHCVVPSGGLSLDGTRWINSREDFFIPVKVLSRKFRGKFLYYLKKEYYSNKQLKFKNEFETLKYSDVFQCFIDRLYKKEWIVYCKPPFGSAEHVLEYLGRYTHRIAISNNRIVAFENGFVVFKWRDYRDNNKEKFMTVTVEEFIRRFIMHILPQKFVKIRHYGLLSNRTREAKLKKCRALLGISITREKENSAKLSLAELLLKLTGIDLTICPCCGEKLASKQKIEPKIFGPPNEKRKTA